MGARAVQESAAARRAELLHKLLENVRDALVNGLQTIFLVGAILMIGAVIASLFLREVPLRKRAAPAASE
jgi:hypothetical protein